MKSGKPKPFRPHGANVIKQHYRLDADDDDGEDHDQDLRKAIMNSLSEVSGASPGADLYRLLPRCCRLERHWRLPARALREGYVRRLRRLRRVQNRQADGVVQAKRAREEINKINERTEKAAWEKQFEEKLFKMTEKSVEGQLSEGS